MRNGSTWAEADHVFAGFTAVRRRFAVCGQPAIIKATENGYREVRALLFQVFSSQEERKRSGGSDFIGLQYCRLPEGTSIQEIISPDSIGHRKNDSLYISGDDMDVFYRCYGPVITGGVFRGRLCGPMDLLGINFYSREQAACILKRVREERPPDGQIFENWLRRGEAYTGFCILGGSSTLPAGGLADLVIPGPWMRAKALVHSIKNSRVIRRDHFLIHRKI